MLDLDLLDGKGKVGVVVMDAEHAERLRGFMADATLAIHKRTLKLRLGDLKQEMQVKVWANDVEYDATVIFRDDGQYLGKPYPNVRIEHVYINPVGGADNEIDLYGDNYRFLVTDKIEEAIKDDIEDRLRREYGA